VSEQTMTPEEVMSFIMAAGSFGGVPFEEVAKARAAVAELVSENETNHRQAFENGKEICRMRNERDALHRRVEEQQAKIDALMLEWCPDEMTPEQMENWGKRQRRCSPEDEAAINAALGITRKTT